MSVNELQACLARIYVDETFRTLYYRDPAAALSGYRLAEAEQHALASLDRRLLEVFADSLRRKRMKILEVAFPILFSIGREEILWYYRRFFQLYPIHEHRSAYRDVVDFGRFIEESLVGAETMPPYASDVAKYERYYFQAALDGASVGPPQAISLDADTRLQLSEWVHVVDFEYDVVEIERMIKAGEVPSSTPGEADAVTILFMPGATPEQPRLLRTNRPTRVILDTIGGHAPLHDIVARVQARLGVERMEEQILAAVERLLEARVLEPADGSTRSSMRGSRWRPDFSMSEAFNA